MPVRVSNILLAFVGMLFWVHLVPVLHNAYFTMFIRMFILLNVNLAVFNLLPIPPLDGSKIFLTLLPQKIYYEIMRYERFGFLILIIALYLGVLDRFYIFATMQLPAGFSFWPEVAFNRWRNYMKQTGTR